MIEWEYKTVELISISSMIAELNGVGHIGWELVGIIEPFCESHFSEEGEFKTIGNNRMMVLKRHRPAPLYLPPENYSPR